MLLLSVLVFTLTMGQFTRMCNLHRGLGSVTVESELNGVWTYIKTIGYDRCEDITFDHNYPIRGIHLSPTPSGDPRWGNPVTIIGDTTDLCDYEKIIWIVQDADGMPTFDLGFGDGGGVSTCAATDLWFMNRCRGGGTMDANALFGARNTDTFNFVSGIEFDREILQPDWTPSSINHRPEDGLVQLTLSGGAVLDLGFNTNEITNVTGKAIYFICEGDDSIGYRGYKVTSISGGVIGSVEWSADDTGSSGTTNLFVWAVLLISTLFF